MPEDNGEKTEDPTPRRRAEAREEGNIARSQDFTAAGMLLISIIGLHVLGLRLLDGLKVSMAAMLRGAHAANLTRPDDVATLAAYGGRMLIGAAAPLMLAVGAVGLVLAAVQVGFLFTVKPITPGLGKINPLKGLANLVNAKAGIRLLMSVLKMAILVGVAAVVIQSDLPAMLHLAQLDVLPAFAAACGLVYGLGLKLAAVLIVLAVIDYGFQRWRHEQDLKMTKKDVKDEMKRMEGDPQLKQRRSKVARQLAEQRLSADVPKADVIVTNPTHFAVALRYDSDTMHAPKVAAKGADVMAQRIRQLAAVHGVPIVERKPLARALYADLEVGQEVPPEHYAAVAEILAYVYRLAERRSA